MNIRYDKSSRPSSPFVDVVVTGPSGKSSSEVGKIDTGADLTSIPARLIRTLDLAENGVERIFGPFGNAYVNTYGVNVTIETTRFKPLDVIPTELDHLLIGRDLINLWSMTLDGKNEAGKISHWSIDPQDVSRQRIPR